MITFSELMKIIPKSEKVELHVLESDTEHIDYTYDQVAKGIDLKHLEHEYHIITIYSYYDKEIGDSVIHVLMSFTGGDKNAEGLR